MSQRQAYIDLLTNLDIPYNPKSEVTLNPNISALVFKGGGEKGLAYAGAMRYFEERGLLKSIHQFGGSSAGGLAAGLMALGFENNAIRQLFAEDFPKWIGIKNVFDAIQAVTKGLPDLFNPDHFGLVRINPIRDQLNERVKQKLSIEGPTREAPTFADLLREKNMDLRLVLVNSVTGERKVFSAKETPNCPIADAMAGTMACPPVFEAIEIDGQKYYDGGVVENNPSQLFNHVEDLESGQSLNERGYNPGLLNLRVDSTLEQDILWGKNPTVINKAKNLIQYLIAIVTQFQGEPNLKDDGPQEVSLNNHNYGTFEVPISPQMIKDLEEEGYQQAKAWDENYRLNAVYDIKQYPTIFERISTFSREKANERAFILETSISFLLPQEKTNEAARERITLLSTELAIIHQTFGVGIVTPEVLHCVEKANTYLQFEKEIELTSTRVADELQQMLINNEGLSSLAYSTKAGQVLDTYLNDTNYAKSMTEISATFNNNIAALHQQRSYAREALGICQAFAKRYELKVTCFKLLQEHLEKLQKSPVNIDNFALLYAPIKQHLTKEEIGLLQDPNQLKAKPELLSELIQRAESHLNHYQVLLPQAKTIFNQLNTTYEQCVRINQRLTTLPEASRVAGKLDSLNQHLSEFINQNQTWLTQLISGFFKVFNIDFNHAPADVYCIEQAKQLSEKVNGFNNRECLMSHSTFGLHDLDNNMQSLVSKAVNNVSTRVNQGLFSGKAVCDKFKLSLKEIVDSTKENTESAVCPSFKA